MDAAIEEAVNNNNCLPCQEVMKLQKPPPEIQSKEFPHQPWDPTGADFYR